MTRIDAAHFVGVQGVVGLAPNGFPCSIARTTPAISVSISRDVISRAMFAADIGTPNSERYLPVPYLAPLLDTLCILLDCESVLIL